MSSDETPSNSVQMRREIRSFVRREGRMTPAQKRAMEALWPKYGQTGSGLINLEAWFGNTHPVVLEIGFGMGTSLAQMAEASPETNFIGIEVHRPGIGALLNEVSTRNLKNVRVIDGDAVEFLKQRFLNESLDRVNVFFPDPWHKTRHHKRRLIQSEFFALLAEKLKPGGMFHAATDWENYAEHILETGSRSPYFENLAGEGRYAPDPFDRPETKFERRGVKLGHGVWDMRWIKQSLKTDPEFALDFRFETDSVWVKEFPLSQLRKHQHPEFPWWILIPRQAGLKEWTDLSFADQIQLQREINETARILQSAVPCEKLNIANLGNKVPQLHIHLIARIPTDSAWPGPVWGK